MYTVLLFAILGALCLVMTGSLSALAFVLFICTTGGLAITWLTHIEFAKARRYGRPPRINRIFD